MADGKRPCGSRPPRSTSRRSRFAVSGGRDPAPAPAPAPLRRPFSINHLRCASSHLLSLALLMHVPYITQDKKTPGTNFRADFLPKQGGGAHKMKKKNGTISSRDAVRIQ